MNRVLSTPNNYEHFLILRRPSNITKNKTEMTQTLIITVETKTTDVNGF